MKNQYAKTVLGVLFAVCCGCTVAQQANASTLNSWDYSIDSFNDGSGGPLYEIQGLAFKETADSVFFALTGGTPLTGAPVSQAVNGTIALGDLFLNPSGQDFQTALAAGEVYGVRFAAANDSPLDMGLYKVDSAISVTSSNAGYRSLVDYHQFFPHANMGTDLVTQNDAYTYLYGDAVASNPNISNTPILNIMESGTRLGGIEQLDRSQLAAEGLDFAGIAGGVWGTETFGFRFDRSLLPVTDADFIAHLLLECGNDAVALEGKLEFEIAAEQSVPEPSAVTGILAVSLFFSGWQLRRKRSSN